MKYFKTAAGLEAIQFAKSKRFFDKLTALMGELRASTDRQNSPFLKEISELVKKETGIISRTVFRNNSIINMSVKPPSVDKNHPLLAELIKRFKWSSEEGLRIAEKATAVGYVNLHEGKVYGIYREIPITFFISSGVFGTNISLSNEECAAIFLHEIGHAFGYFEYLGTTVTRNLALVAVVEQVLGTTKDIPHRVKILNAAKQIMHLNELNVEDAAKVNDKASLQLVLVNSESKKVRSEIGSDFYDLTTYEYISDQYATRQGAGLTLVTALEKVYRYGDVESEFISNQRFVAMEIAKTLTVGLALVFSFTITAYIVAISAIIGILINPLKSTYDSPKDRFERIKQQLISELATSDLSEDKEYKRAILADIDLINNILADMTTRRTLYEYIFTTFVKSHKNDLTQKQLQKDLEKISRSDLFVAAAKLNTLL